MENENGIKRNEVIKFILSLLDDGDEKIKLPPSADDNFILFVGNTGAGKSTISQFLSNSSENLISIETSPNSSEYIISDDNNKISTHSTIKSKTIFPDLIVNGETKTVFYDCPGFSDTRSAAHDIAATCLTKKVVDMANKVKLLFVVNYPSVRKGVDRQDFMLLLKHALNFTRNIDKLKNSVALLVTKVDNQCGKIDGCLKLIPDENVISSIAEFLLEVKNSIYEKKSDSNGFLDDPKFDENAIKFIDILLEMEGTYYKRIGIFRRPDEAGPLLNIDFFKHEKNEIGRIIHENILFSEKSEDDFGYSISDDSKNYVYDLYISLNDCITAEIQQIGDKIKTHLKNIENDNCHDIYNLLSKFKFTLSIFTELICNLSSDVSCIKHFIMNYNDMDIDIFKMNLKNIENHESYLKFLELVSDKITLKRSEYTKGFSNIMTFIKVSKDWYYFLVDLYSILSDYSIQKDINKFDVNNLMELCLDTETDVTKSKIFSDFLHFINERIKGRRLEPFYIEPGFILNREKFMCLKHVLHHTINHKTSKERPSPDKIIIKGAYINLDANSLKENVTYIEIYATNKIFISEDINKTGYRTQLCIISPVWEVISDRKIVLDGSDGLACSEGAPGKAGGPAGNFFGITGDVRGGFLEITANGGKGGPGGDGKPGKDGTKGEDGPHPSRVKGILDGIGKAKEYNGFKYFVKEAFGLNALLVSGKYLVYKAFGKKASPGSNGGNGGAGGKGGYEGKIRVIDLSNSVKMSFSNSTGEDGPVGKGGEGGKGAKDGRTVTAFSGYYTFLFFKVNDIPWENIIYESSKTSSESGKRGVDGDNKRGWEEPEVGENMVDYFTIVNTYKTWASKSLTSWIGDPSLPCFLEKIERIYSQNKNEESQNITEGSQDKLETNQNVSTGSQSEFE